MTPTAAAIVVSYNAGKELSNCLDSLKQADPTKLTTVIIDNNSTDPAVKSLLNQAKSWAKVIFNRSNIGFGPANNLAAEQVKTDWLIFINSDTYWPAGCLKRFVDLLTAQPAKVVAVGPKLLNPDGSLQPSFGAKPNLINLTAWALGLDNLIPLPALHVKKPLIYQRPQPVGWLSGAFVAIRKEAFERVGGWPTDIFMYGEDVILSLKLHRLGTLMYLPQVSFYHIGQASGSRVLARLREAWFWYQWFGQGRLAWLKKLYLYFIILAGFGLRLITFGLMGRWSSAKLNAILFSRWLRRHR